MTVKRDLKRRVRQRQARTGESYVTARRHVVAARSDASEAVDEGEDEAGNEAENEAGNEAENEAGNEAGNEATGAGMGDVAPDRAVAAQDMTALASASLTAAAARDPTPTTASPAAVSPAAASPDPATTIAVAEPPRARSVGAPPFEVGDEVQIIEGPLAGHRARIEKIRTEDRKLELAVRIGGAAMSVVLEVAAIAAVAAQPATDAAPTAPDAAARAGLVPVVELVDITPEARRLGFLCRVAVVPSLIERIEPAVALRGLRDLLVETAGDPEMMMLSQIALRGTLPSRAQRVPPDVEGLRRLIRRAGAGMGGVSAGGTLLAFHASGRDGAVPILCAPGGHGASLVLSVVDELTAEARWIELRLAMVPWHRRAALAPEPVLFVIYDGRRYPITRDEFLIGRNSRDVHLAIEDGLVSRHHAAVIRRNGVHYIKNLGSTHGITYKGMQIDNKRIDEGDVFQIGDHALCFTYRSEDKE